MHIAQEMRMLAVDESVLERAPHPIELMARAYGIPGEWSDKAVRKP